MTLISAHKNGSAAVFRTRKLPGLGDVFAFVRRANEVARQRRALMQLGDMALKDFGASRADAWHESGRPWWDLPKR
jgi:uncharacterized protein YjiS (DUF1127 family)